MDQNNDYYAYTWKDESTPPPKKPKKEKVKVSIGVLIAVVAIVAMIAVIVTYTLTASSKRSFYTEKLLAQQALINQLKENNTEVDASKLEIIAQLIDQYAYYADEISEEDLMEAIVKVYAEKMGDHYAEYYTEAEYKAMTEDNVGNHHGIGISVVQTALQVNGYEYQVFQIIAIYKNAPAESTGLAVGDCVYALKLDGEYKTVEELGGYSKAISLMKGETDTRAEFAVLRADGEGYRSIEFSIARGPFETSSVSYTVSQMDATVGIVRINQFDLTTPHQMKDAVNTLKQRGITKFIFDVRNNPGGDLQSIKASLTYFLQKGDLILSAIDKDGNVARSYYAESINYNGDYASCNVTEEEIGMYADLDIVVLCNGNTASAAEVFTATLRDYGLATVVGEKTFGKGIMQSFLSLSMLGDYSGYLKITTYAYVTKCGETYHEIGIIPQVEEVLSDEAKQYNFYILPQEKDNQLIAAIQQIQ